jgi:RNA polymerase sigma-70 factor (ECF subfamily)
MDCMSAELPTSVSLIARVQQNESRAWHELVAIYLPLVFTWCRQSGVSADDAADVAQEVFRAVHRTVCDFRRAREGDSFRGWLWTITRNKVRDHFRAAADRPDAAGGTDAHMRFAELPDEEPATTGSEVSMASQSPIFSALELVRGEFTESTWQAFWRATVLEQETAQISQDLGISINAVRLAKSRVLRRLRDRLTGLID